ncbi:metal-dependent phosphohydrolase [Rhodococcus phage Trina]|uniref:Phosphohydrolase n=1 Tax=Rhodococcus phage Trina TaxID=2027905 RepID=A0A2D1A475_9CAUD|nr:metal-dependent phosphohydrolase [Rhodococcus phage Trina]ASZ74946.1 phosphohydrolase [Rhodococcus phage Trina]
MYNKLADVIALAEFAHRNQVDKAGMPYIEHPRRVMQSVQNQGALPYIQMAAILHDVIEDTPFTAEMLIELGVPAPAVEIVVLLTRTKTVAPRDYYLAIRENPAARMVKLADIDDNTQGWRLSYLPLETQQRLDKKYYNAKLVLNYADNLGLEK